VRLNSYLLALLVCFVATATAADSVRDELAREILRRVSEWPQAQVEIPISVYEMFVRDALLGPTPPKPPEAAWIERAAWTLRAGESDEAVLEAALDVAILPGSLARHVKLLPTAVAWRDVAIDGKAAALRRADDGWFWLDNYKPGRYRVTAKAALKPERRGDQRRLAWATPPAAWATAAAESDAAWEVRFSRASTAVIGGEKGTHGAVGLVPGDRLEVTWQKPQPPVHRAAQIESEAQVGWTLGEGVHQVRAVVNLRLWGGEVQELTVNLPQGADRVSITGPDVREVQPAGGAARVFLRGPVTQRTRLSVSFEVPRAKTGRMAFPAFIVEGASARGGTLAIGGGAGAVLLEMESPGLAPMALHDLPDAVRGLLAAPPVYAYQAAAGSWDARIDVVDMAEFPVRETLVDSALYTMLYRPDGHIMTKVVYEVRNRGQQYMKIELPPGSQLLVARVAEQQKNMARGPGDTVFVPLEKSVLTTAGLVSFPVEVVYATKGPALARAGRLRLPLPRTDLPVAYARCAVSVPDGLRVRQWEGMLREVPSWSNETAEMEFEYGHGHLAAGLKAPEPKPSPKPVKAPEAKAPPKLPPAKPEGKPVGGDKLGLATVPLTGNLFGAAQYAPVEKPAAPATPPAAQEPRQSLAEDTERTPDEERRDRQALIIQGKNYYRAGNDYYNRGDYQRAQDLFNKVVEVAPDSTEAENAKKFLGNVKIALGKQDKSKGEDRSLRATTKAVQMAQQFANVDFVSRQQELLEQAEQSIKAGNETDAEAAYKVALNLSGKLQARGEEAKEQEAVVRKAKEFVQKREEGRKVASQEVAKLQEQVQSLRQSIVQKGAGDVPVAIDALTDTNKVLTAGVAMAPRVEVGTALRDPGGTTSGAVAGRAQWGAAGRAVPSTSPPPAGPGVAESRLGVAAGWEAAQPTAPAQPAPQIQLGEAIAEQQVSQRGKGNQGTLGGYGRFGGAATTFSGAAAIDDPTALKGRAEQLKRQVEELKSVKQNLEKESFDVNGDGLTAVLRSRPAPRSPVSATDARDLGRMVSEKAKDIDSRADKAVELARHGRIAEAQNLLADLDKDEKTVARDAAALVKTGAGTFQIMSGAILADRGTTAAPEGADQPKDREDLTKFRRYFTPPSPAAPPAVAETRRKLDEARQAVANKARELSTVNLSVAGIVQGKDDEKKLAEFVQSNYGWALQTNATGGGPGAGSLTKAGAGTLTLSGANTYTGGTTVTAGALTISGTAGRSGGNLQAAAPQGQTFFYDSGAANNAGQVTLRAGDSGLVVANDATVAGNVNAVLERLRLNMGQSVAVGSRNIFVGPSAARAAGIEWKKGANGVAYAVLDEGQLLSLMDIEQRASNAAKADAPQGDVRQEAVVGTPAIMANGGVVAIDRAADTSNTLNYNGNAVQVAHEDYLLISNGGYLTAVKSARMQHWTAEAGPVRFPGVPAVVTVPVVGRTVKFEKTLVDASDSLELAADYSWQGDEK
jgi:autotransporter-associated beta strand protein